MNETEGEALFSQLLSSGIKGELLTLFHKNPGLVDTLEGVARRIGKKGDAVGPDLSDLVGLGVLEKRQVGRAEVFCLNRQKDREAKARIASYLMSLKK